MKNKHLLIVALAGIMVGAILGGVLVQYRSETEINLLKIELEETISMRESCADRVNVLEEAIEVIVMERTTYVELSFAEIQRLRAELNSTRQLLLEMNQTRVYD